MANLIRLKRASGSDPAASDLVSGEPAVRTDTGELFFKKDDGSVAKVSGAGGGPDFKYLALRNAANNGAASYPNADFTLVTSGTTTALTPTAANTLLVSVNGVIQKPNTGTSTPSSGFALSGSTIKFGANISAAPDFILYQESGGIGEPSDETVGEDKLKVSNSPVNGYFLSAQSGNTGGLTWAAPVATSCTGNSATATALATARAINGVNFDGTAAITVTAAAGTLSGNTLNSSVTASSLTSLGDLAGLTVDGDATFTGANYNVLWDKSDNALEFADNAKAVFGTGSDLQIYHDGTHSQIKDASSGELLLSGSVISLNSANSAEYMLKGTENAAVELYWDNSKKFETTTNGVHVTGDLRLNDNEQVYLGNSTDFQLFHDPSVGNVIRSAFCSLVINDTSGTTGAIFKNSGAVELNHNGSKKFETTSGGASVTGQIISTVNFRGGDNVELSLGDAEDLKIFHNGSFSYLKNTTDYPLYIQNIDGQDIFISDINGGNVAAKFNIGDSAELYYDNSKKFETTSSGVSITGNLDLAADGDTILLGTGDDFQISFDGTNGVLKGASGVQNINVWTENSAKYQFTDGSFRPLSNNSYDLGDSSLRWRNIYTNDLNLSNQGSTNTVDNTWGDYTIQEGESDLFLINNRNGKKYKFNLTEVS